jgi:sulfoxide reductase heme-binding subunit YedZ
MKTVRAALNSPYFFWALLALPSLPMLAALGGDDPRVYHRLLHPTGEFAARFLILSLMVTPLMMALPGWRGPRWLRARRRYLGVASFGYAALHTVFYLIDEGAAAFAAHELARTAIWSGWAASLIFVPLAATSFDGAVRALGPGWKAVQRWVYPAALLTLLHWATLRHGLAPALVHFAPLAALEAFRVWRNATRRRAAA